MSIDAHCHVWRLDRGDYGWLDTNDAALAPLRRDFGLSDLPDAPARFTVDGFVLVQAAPTLAETDFMLETARQGDNTGTGRRVAGVVGWVDLADPCSVVSLERFAADPLFKGIRPMLQDHPDLDWIATEPSPDCIAALGRLGLRFDALVTPRNLPSLLRFLEANPSLPVMVDHVAKPAFGAPTHDDRHALWRDGMRALAGAPNVCCKLSGLLTELPQDRRRSCDVAVESLKPLRDDLLGWFGADRIAWGSDWPVLSLATSAAFWMTVTDDLLSPLDAGERTAILGETAIRFYDLGSRSLGDGVRA